MADKTAIEWSDATWNPTTGCDRVSPGCDNCYALRMAGRLKLMGSPRYQADGDPRTSGPGFGIATHRDVLGQPLRWTRPRRIFVNSMSDLFHPGVLADAHPDNPRPFLAEVFAVMAAADWHTFQVLTKRPQAMAAVLRHPMFKLDVNAGLLELGHPVMPGGMSEPETPWPAHMWLGTSIEADRFVWRANHLRDTPAAVRFLSLEPLLGPVPSLDLAGIDWCIVGGESGPGARPMHPGWVRDVRDRCAAAGVPFFFKQWGAWAPDPDLEMAGVSTIVPEHGGTGAFIAGAGMTRVGKHAAGRVLDGRTWDEYPHG